VIEMSREDVGRAGLIEWGMTAESFIQHAPERIEIGARIDHVPSDLLRRHVVRGSCSRGAHRRHQGLPTNGAARPAGEAEIHEHGTEPNFEKDVAGLQIAMNHSALVNVHERRANLAIEVEDVSKDVG
jgi:hypothetical protein